MHWGRDADYARAWEPARNFGPAESVFDVFVESVEQVIEQREVGVENHGTTNDENLGVIEVTE